MIKCPKCDKPLNGFKLLFKTDYSKIECGNCGSKWNLKVKKNKSLLWGVSGGVFGPLAFLAFSFLGFLWGSIAVIALLIIYYLVMRNFVENFIEIVKY